MAKPKKQPKNDMIGHNYNKEDRAKLVRKIFKDWAAQKREKDALAADHRERNEKNKAHLAELGFKKADAAMAFRMYQLQESGETEAEGIEQRDIALDTLRECMEAMTGDQLDMFAVAAAADKARKSQADREAEGTNKEAE